jgi:hypothetical protein
MMKKRGARVSRVDGAERCRVPVQVPLTVWAELDMRQQGDGGRESGRTLPGHFVLLFDCTAGQS